MKIIFFLQQHLVHKHLRTKHMFFMPVSSFFTNIFFSFLAADIKTNKVPGFPVDISRGFSPSFALNLLWKKMKCFKYYSLLLFNPNQEYDPKYFISRYKSTLFCDQI